MHKSAVKTDVNWTRMLRKLALFQRAYGHIRVNEQAKRFPALARWLATIQGRLQLLTYDQILSLDNLGFFNRLDQHWLDRYAKLRDFKRTTGHCNVPARWPENRQLATWVQVQRDGVPRMAPWRRKLLTDLGFCFRIFHKGPPMDWDELIKRLKRYKRRFANCNVPNGWREDKSLAYRIIQLRCSRKSLGCGQISQLDALGFDWTPLRTTWEKRFRELETFKKRHGHCRVPDKSSKLGIWVGRIRRRKAFLSAVQIRRLDKIAFDWCPHKTAWNEHYKSLVEFSRTFGHANVAAHSGEYSELGIWASEQRVNKAKLSPEQVMMLDKVGFEWSPHEAAWMRHYEELRAYQRENGHCDPPVSRSALGRWVDQQRRQRAEMPPDRRKLLVQIGLTWTPRTHTIWMRRYEELKAYHSKHGRSPYAGESPLSSWANTQRQFYAKGKIPPERKKLLDEIGFAWRVYARH